MGDPLGIRLKLLAVFLITLIGGMAVYGFMTYSSGRDVLLQSTARHLEAVATSQTKSVRKTILAWSDRVALIASRTQLRVKLRDHNRTTDPAAAARIERIIADAKTSTRAVRCIAIFGTKGNLVASAGEAGICPSQPPTAEKDISLERITAPEDEHHSVLYTAPLRLEGKVVGTARVALDASELSSVTGDYTGLGETGETVISRREENGGITLLTPIRFRADRVMTRQPPEGRKHAPMLSALDGREVTIMGRQVDYKGAEVMAVTRHIPEQHWGLVVKMDLSEALRPLEQYRRVLLIAGLLTIGIGTAVVILVSRSLLRPIKELAKAADGIRDGDYDVRLTPRSQDELGLLAETFNAMAEALVEASGKLERARDQAETRLREAIESVPDGFVLWDHEDRLVMCNKTYREMYPTISDDIIPGATFERIARLSVERGQYHIDGDPEDWIKERLRRHRESKGSSKQSLSNGRVVLVAERSTPNGDCVGVRTDITDLEAAMRRLEQYNRELESFAHVASHDLREPLRMVSAYLQLLEKRYADTLDQNAREYIDFAVTGAKRMDSLIRDLLQYSRVESQGESFVAIDSQEVLLETLDNLQATITDAGGIVTFDGLPTVMADRLQLMQVFQNLIGNALKYRADGHDPVIHIQAATHRGVATFSVRDNGIGIEPEYYERIFVIFQRLHGRDEFSGTGIGLAVCKRIVDRHAGRIWVESAPGEGSTFHFTMPLAC